MDLKSLTHIFEIVRGVRAVIFSKTCLMSLMLTVDESLDEGGLMMSHLFHSANGYELVLISPTTSSKSSSTHGDCD
jgi:hypothetical protein